jgi:von Willebrand factor type A domain
MPLAELTFLTPVAALFALAAVVPLVAFVDYLRRDRRVRAVLGMSLLPRASRVTTGAALAFVPAIMALAATQPTLELGREQHLREDAEAYVVFDTSRSMLAAEDADGPNRLQRAERLAAELRRELPTVPVGVASFTDRVLPHLLPSVDRNAFTATVSRSIGIEQPPPSSFYVRQATQLAALRSLATQNFFSPTARYRLAIVYTDGESDPAPARIREVFSRHGVRALFVHTWDEDEKVFGTGGEPEPDYRADARSPGLLRQMAAATRGRVFAEDEPEELTDAAKTMLGPESNTTARREEQIPLAPWITLAAFLPLGLILLRRNF